MQIHIYASKNVSVKDIGSWASMVLLTYQNFIEMPSNMIYIVTLSVGFKCPRKINLNTQWGGDSSSDDETSDNETRDCSPSAASSRSPATSSSSNDEKLRAVDESFNILHRTLEDTIFSICSIVNL